MAAVSAGTAAVSAGTARVSAVWATEGPRALGPFPGRVHPDQSWK